MNSKALIRALLIAAVLQLAMVLAGHWVAFVKDNLFAVLGTAISALGAILYVRAARPAWLWAALGGAIVGGVSALAGIAVSYALGDVTADILTMGTLASAVAGLIAGAATRFFAKPAP